MAGKLYFVPSVKKILKSHLIKASAKYETYLANINCWENDERRAGDGPSPLQRITLLEDVCRLDIFTGATDIQKHLTLGQNKTVSDLGILLVDWAIFFSFSLISNF